MQNENVKISGEVFDNLLSLSMLSAEKDEKDVLSSQVGQLVNYFEILEKFAGSVELPYAKHGSSSLRSSSIGPNIAQFDLKKMSSEYMDSYFRVPKVL